MPHNQPSHVPAANGLGRPFTLLIRDRSRALPVVHQPSEGCPEMPRILLIQFLVGPRSAIRANSPPPQLKLVESTVL